MNTEEWELAQQLGAIDLEPPQVVYGNDDPEMMALFDAYRAVITVNGEASQQAYHARLAIATLYEKRGLILQARFHLEKGLRQSLRSLDAMQQMDGYYRLAVLNLRSPSNLEVALDLLRQALQIAHDEGKMDHVSVAEIHHTIGRVFQESAKKDASRAERQDDCQHAAENYQRAEEIFLASYGEQHEKVAIVRASIAATEELRGNPRDAYKYFGLALKTLAARFKEDDPVTLWIRKRLARIDRAWKHYESALRTFSDILRIKIASAEAAAAAGASQETMKARHCSIAGIYSEIALVYEDMRDWENAIVYYNRDLVVSMRNCGKESRDVAAVYNNLADVYKKRGDAADPSDQEARFRDFTTALELYQRSAAIDDALDAGATGNRLAGTAITRGNIGIVLCRLGRVAEGRAALQSCLDTLPPNFPKRKHFVRELANHAS